MGQRRVGAAAPRLQRQYEAGEGGLKDRFLGGLVRGMLLLECQRAQRLDPFEIYAMPRGARQGLAEEDVPIACNSQHLAEPLELLLETFPDVRLEEALK